MSSSFASEANYSIILVNYKSLELTRSCLDLLQQGLQGTEVPIWVVDNDSNDESSEYLRTLDWINLIERKPREVETGSVAHGKALDLALTKVETEYVFLLHTDTFIYDPAIFTMMIATCAGSQKVAAAGCVEQLNRGLARSAWRLTSRFIKHYVRRGLRALGIATNKEPKPFMEKHLRSFCALGIAQLIKRRGLHFLMDDRNPGYELQDRMVALGYKINLISSRKVFSYLDHLQSGTVSAIGGYARTHRRVKMYNEIIGKCKVKGQP